MSWTIRLRAIGSVVLGVILVGAVDIGIRSRSAGNASVRKAELLNAVSAATLPQETTTKPTAAAVVGGGQYSPLTWARLTRIMSIGAWRTSTPVFPSTQGCLE